MKKIVLTLACMSFVFSAYSAQHPLVAAAHNPAPANPQTMITEFLGRVSAGMQTLPDSDRRKFKTIFLQAVMHAVDPNVPNPAAGGAGNRDEFDPQAQALVWSRAADLGAAWGAELVAEMANGANRDDLIRDTIAAFGLEEVKQELLAPVEA